MIYKKSWMVKRAILFLMLSVLMITSIMAQENIGQTEVESKNDVDVSVKKHKFDIGIGLGCDYSGLGIKFSYLPIPYFSLFASGGYAMFELAWNIGACYHIIPKTSEHFIRPHIKAMYGYNEIIYLLDAKEYNQTYYGFTPGIGIELRFRESKNHGFDCDLNFPFRSDEFKDDFKEIDENPDVDIKEPCPIALAIGYHFEF